MWIGEVTRKSAKTVHFNWVFNKEGDNWIGGGLMTPKGEKCKLSSVLASFSYPDKTLMPKGLTSKLNSLWQN